MNRIPGIPGWLAAAALVAGSWVAPVATGSVRPESLQRGAAERPDPDWPCIQRKVPELSVATVWSGLAVEEALGLWRNDPAVVDLVVRIAARRTPLEEATAAISEFARTLPPDLKAQTLTALFAGLFQTLDGERREVIAGIERYGRKQKDMAERIRADMSRASDAGTGADPQGAAELQNRLIWETRIFNERRASLTFVCEVPTILEQRLFVLARAIAAELPN